MTATTAAAENTINMCFCARSLIKAPQQLQIPLATNGDFTSGHIHTEEYSPFQTTLMAHLSETK